MAALTAKGYDFPPLSGQDGDPANLNNVALGKQYVDVWKNANELGKAAGQAALDLCAGTAMADLTLPDGFIDPSVAPVAGNTVQDFDDARRHRGQVLHPPADAHHRREPR